MTKLPLLYARGANDKVLTWQMIVEGDTFYVTSGQQDGAAVTSKPNRCAPKNIGRANATTAEEQALAEATAKWEKKLKSGGYYEDIKDIDGTKFFEPMLAKSYGDYQGKMPFPALVDRKYNGGRAIAQVSGMWTRKGEKYATVPHIEAALTPFFVMHRELVLDGELYNHDYRFQLNEIMKLIRRTKNVTLADLAASREKIRYYVYDGFGVNGTTADSPVEERRAALANLLGGVEFVTLVPGQVVSSEEEMFKCYNSYVEDGYEGAMYRRLGSPYQNKRVKDLLKIKPEMDAEGVILDVLLGSGNWGDAAKTVTLKWQDKTFDATIVGNHEQAVQFWKDRKQWIGRDVTFLYIGLTGLGIPSSARLDINNCLKQ